MLLVTPIDIPQIYRWQIIFQFSLVHTVYVLIEVYCVSDRHTSLSATNIPHQIHTKCLIKHQKIVKKR